MLKVLSGIAAKTRPTCRNTPADPGCSEKQSFERTAPYAP